MHDRGIGVRSLAGTVLFLSSQCTVWLLGQPSLLSSRYRRGGAIYLTAYVHLAPRQICVDLYLPSLHHYGSGEVVPVLN
jgi:hypothetical protein